MITLGTGLPGNGKTLYMLWYIAAKAKKENREVYYHNIKGLNGAAVGNWQEFDPFKWYELPAGAIVVIDECQDVFGKKPNGAVLPEHYSKLNTHRHNGHDLFLISQHPTLLDNNVRRLVGQHFHSVRKFGLQRATIYEWSACQPAPENVASHKSAVALKWKFPKEVFTWYKSAEVHTVKRAIPPKIIVVAVGVVAFLAYGYYSLQSYQHRFDKKAPESTAAVPAPVGGTLTAQEPVQVTTGPSGGSQQVDPVEDAKKWLWKETPRVSHQQWTAPKYDGMTTPTSVPVPAACIQIGDVTKGRTLRCQCYSQQGTKMDVEFNMCVSIANNGYFREFNPDGQGQREQADRQERSVAVLSDRPDAALPERRGMQSQVVALADIPDTPARQVRTGGGSILGK